MSTVSQTRHPSFPKTRHKLRHNKPNRLLAGPNKNAFVLSIFNLKLFQDVAYADKMLRMLLLETGLHQGGIHVSIPVCAWR